MTDRFELTPSQTQIWIGQRLNPESPLYNMAFAFVFPAGLRVDLFLAAWRQVAEAGDALRTRLVDRAGETRVTLSPEIPETSRRDFSERRDPGEEFRRWCRERATRALPLDGSLVDSVLVDLDGGRTGWYLSQHHLITDAWSTRLLFRQLQTRYASLLGDEAPTSSTLYPYYSPATRGEESAQPGHAAAEHWAARWNRPGRQVPLYGRPARPVGTASRRLTLEIDQDRARALEEIARQEGFVSLSDELSRFALFASLLAAWLYRVGGRSELGFDAPVAGRPDARSKQTPGLFIEMFPFAATVGPADSFRSLGARCLQEAMLYLQHAVAGTSRSSGTSAGNIVLNYFPAAFGTFAGLPVEVEWVHPGHGDSVHALRLQVHDFGGTGRYVLHFDINEGALPEPFRARCAEHFGKILDALLADPDSIIAALDLETEAERRGLSALNATSSSPLPDRSVVASFDQRAMAEPQRIALREGSSELTFGELREQSVALAAALVEHGLEPGDRVAIAGRRSIPAVIAVLASMRAGGAYVPIDRFVPTARRQEILRDSGARILLSGRGEENAEGPPEGVVRLAIADGIRAGRGRDLERPLPGLDDLAYLMYTSGSSGRPKGVLVEHGGLTDYLEWASRQYVRGDRLSYPLFTSLGFDLTVTSLFLPLITGGTLEIFPEPDGPVDTALMDVLEADCVDFVKLTPSHLSLLRRLGLERSRIRRMVVGGEALKTALAAAVHAQLRGRVEIYNEYGPTEAIVGCVMHRYDPETDTGDDVPIGMPADHVEVEILNEVGAVVPEGVPGELWVSRFGLARGYHGAEALTAERFQSRAEPSGVRRYRTGDQVRIGSTGRLEYLGRLDRQLKLSGFRVEPGEIEAALLEVPGIEQAAVLAHRRRAAGSSTTQTVRHCVRCGLPSNQPGAALDEAGVCSLCRSYASIRDEAQGYFKTMEDLEAVFQESSRGRSEYDCMMLLSGGKDSTYALCRLVDMGLSVFAFTLDNGYISDAAKDNIRAVCGLLGVPVEFATTPAMNAIFRDSLIRFANVCNGCFKTIYTLSMRRARDLGIPIIVTGLSRGQMFETRLTEEMFRDGRCSPEEVDAAVLAARKVYHRLPDEVTRSLNQGLFDDDRIFQEIQFVDFYRFCDVGMEELYAYLDSKPWVRPADTGRSTNCLINDAGIHIHKKERGFHNYALPYSWDVRLGHKEREAAMEELDDDIDTSRVREILEEIGFDEDRMATDAEPTSLHAFYVASDEIPEEEIRRQLGRRLPIQLIPAHLRRLESIPLTPSGKVDEKALALEVSGRRPERPYRPAEGPVQEYLTALWQEELAVERVGADDGFFELGGTSLAAMKVMLRLCREFDIDLPLETLFSHPRLSALARVAEDRILADVAQISAAERRTLLAEPDAS